MAHTTMTFGILPSYPQFEAAFKAECPTGTFAFGRDKRVGTCNMNCEGLYCAVEDAIREYEQSDESSEDESDADFVNRPEIWASGILSILGFEWV